MHNRDSRRRKKEKGIGNIFQEIVTKKVVNLKETDIKIQKHRG